MVPHWIPESGHQSQPTAWVVLALFCLCCYLARHYSDPLEGDRHEEAECSTEEHCWPLPIYYCVPQLREGQGDIKAQGSQAPRWHQHQDTLETVLLQWDEGTHSPSVLRAWRLSQAGLSLYYSQNFTSRAGLVGTHL